jgi:hypothetical protein
VERTTRRLTVMLMLGGAYTAQLGSQSPGSADRRFTRGRNYAGPALSRSGVGTAPVVGGFFEHA